MDVEIIAWLTEWLELRRGCGWESSPSSYERFAESAARTGYWTMAYEVATEIAPDRRAIPAMVVRAGRYEREGNGWFGGPTHDSRRIGSS